VVLDWRGRPDTRPTTRCWPPGPMGPDGRSTHRYAEVGQQVDEEPEEGLTIAAWGRRLVRRHEAQSRAIGRSACTLIRKV
jgi:hypothetical protein